MLNLYFDNASTSFPKPRAVAEAMSDFLSDVGGTYSRAAYPRVMKSSFIVEQCRMKLLSLLNGAASDNIVFTANATHAANTLLLGLGLEQCRVLISPLEHNAIMRPLEWLRQNKGVQWEVLPAHSDGRIDLDRLREVDLEGVKLIVINHMSNINGAIQPIAEIKKWAEEVPIAVDSTQSLGSHTINTTDDNLDFVIFTGHKGLMGPTGTGGLYIKDGRMVSPSRFGGTSTLSHSIDSPSTLPDSLEVGTPNMVGIAGLLAAIDNPYQSQHNSSDFAELLAEVKAISKLKTYCSSDLANQGELFSITHETLPVYALAQRLYDEYQIESRSGIHCAPMAHKYLGTEIEGTVRLSLSAFHTREDILYLLKALREICQ